MLYIVWCSSIQKIVALPHVFTDYSQSYLNTRSPTKIKMSQESDVFCFWCTSVLQRPSSFLLGISPSEDFIHLALRQTVNYFKDSGGISQSVTPISTYKWSQNAFALKNTTIKVVKI